MKATRQSIGGLGNLMFKQAFILGQYLQGDIPDSYVQGISYWKRHENEIKKIFSEGIGYDDRVSIHVRRGDYVDSNFHFDLTKTEYYDEAMGFFPKSTETKFLVFSDDIEWCKQQWQFEGCDFSEGKSEVEDLNLMASCKSNIIANSTFSWWAAWLNPNADKKVICPKKWFVDGKERIELPEEWIKI